MNASVTAAIFSHVYLFDIPIPWQLNFQIVVLEWI